MTPNEALAVLKTAKHHDRWMLPNDPTEAENKATEWAICLPEKMQTSHGIAAVRAHYASEKHREPLTIHHLIDWFQANKPTQNQPKHNPMVLANPDGTYSAWCPCNHLDTTDLPNLQAAEQLANTHHKQATAA